MQSTEDDLTNILHLCPDLKTLIPSAVVLWQNIRGVVNLSNATKSWEYFLKIKAMIISKAPVSQIKSVCKLCPGKWAEEFAQTLTTKPIDCKMACSALTDCFEKQFQTVALQMLGNAIVVFCQSVRAWKAVYDFQMPSCQKQVEQVRVYLDESAAVLNRMITVENLNIIQREELQRAENWLTDAKNVLETIRSDFENKIREAKQHKSNNRISAAINLVSTIINLAMFRSITTKLDEFSWTTASAGAATVINVGCTIGDLIAAGKADELVEEMTTKLNNINELEDERTRILTRIKILLR